MASKRPRRGHPGPTRNVLISGDTGPREPQGGARPLDEEYRESGDLEAREFGVPQADIPGGVRHLVNPETVAHKPPGVFERPADYHKYHGVESDDGQYYPPPADVGKSRGTVAVPKIDDAVPVRVVQENAATIRDTLAAGPKHLLSNAEPIRIADRDPNRVEIHVTVEGGGGAIRVGSQEQLLQGEGMQIQAGAGTAVTQRFKTQNQLYIVQDPVSSSATVSWAVTTEIPAAIGEPRPAEHAATHGTHTRSR